MSEGREAARRTEPRLIAVKVGSSTVTRQGGPPDDHYLRDLAAQIAAQRKLDRAVILITSGAIPVGVDRLALSERPRLIPQKQAVAAIGQGLLMHAYATVFAEYGIPVAQVLLTRDDFRDRSRYLNALNAISAILEYGAVPIVNENDTVAVEEIKFGENDTLAALVASFAEADALLLLSDVDGLYDRDPGQDPGAKLVPVVEKVDRALEAQVGGARSAVGTGGMVTKVRAARICASSGIPLTIANGRRPNVIADALAGKCGTLFLPRAVRLRQRKRWIAYGAPPKGTVVVNDGARQRVVGEGKSLLPAGVVSLSGRFRMGDLVQLVDSSGQPFAQGFVNYADDELLRIMGRRTTDIAAILGHKTRDEVVHRDDLVLDL